MGRDQVERELAENFAKKIGYPMDAKLVLDCAKHRYTTKELPRMVWDALVDAEALLRGAA